MKLSGKFGRGPRRKSLTGTISPLRSLHTSNARVYTAHCASSSLGHPAGREFGKPSCGMGTIPQRRKRSGSRAGTGPGDARKSPSAGAGDGEQGGRRAPAHPREAPAPGTHSASGAEPPGRPQARRSQAARPAPEAPASGAHRSAAPSSPARRPAGRTREPPGPSRAPQETTRPRPRPQRTQPRRPRGPRPCPPGAEPRRAAQPLPGVPGGCQGLHGRCPASLEPGRALGGGGGASLTAQRLRGAPGPRGAPGIFFWETSPQSVGLSSRAGKVLSAGRLRPSGNFAGM